MANWLCGTYPGEQAGEGGSAPAWRWGQWRHRSNAGAWGGQAWAHPGGGNAHGARGGGASTGEVI